MYCGIVGSTISILHFTEKSKGEGGGSKYCPPLSIQKKSW